MNWVDDFAASVVADYAADHLIDYGPEEQQQRAVAALRRFERHTPLRPHVETINAFGFATVQTVLVSSPSNPSESTDTYLRLLPLAEAIGISPGQAEKWAEGEHGFALRDQRAMDEEMGCLGWECLRSVVCLDLSLIFEDETAKPDANGKRWSSASEWLVSLDRLMALLLVSPWGAEFMKNSKALFSYAFKHSGMEAGADAVPTLEKREGPDGSPELVESGFTLADVLRRDRDGISEEEATRRAFLGPAGALHDVTPEDDTQ